MADTETIHWRVRIRMYRRWLGDCFLLSFRNGDGLSHILIDCGALSGTPDGKAKLQAAAGRIREDTDGKLDALIVTHEHWDHVSGFYDALEEFRQLAIGEVWAAWTEDPDQDVARASKKRIRDRLQTVRLAMQRFSQSDAADDEIRGSALAGTSGFFPLGDSLAAFSEKTGEAMTAALSLGKKKVLLDPGDVVERKWLPGVRVYVLGPPKNLTALHNLKGHPSTDMYGGKDALAAAGEVSLAAAMAGSSAAGMDQYAPFDRYLQWGAAAWSASKEWPELAKSYAGEPQRRIERDWLNAAAELALQLDSYTNNTSLALAFELADTQEVLLFAGDAQIGNWLSWADVQFPAKRGSQAPTAADLLARTVFYKVGHHGSHNATLRAGGLESMNSPRLVAAIPVDEEFARRPKGSCPNGWDMPAGPLLKALTEKTKGRVLRSDRDLPAGKQDATWQEFAQSVHCTEHYVEYCIRR